MAINENYSSKENIKQIKEEFNKGEFKAISLQDFFDKETFKKMFINIKGLQFKEKRQPNIYNYKIKIAPKHIQAILNSKEITKLIEEITNNQVKELQFEAFLFTWKNYTLLHDKAIEKPGIDIIFELTQEWEEHFGGATIYTDTKGNVQKIMPQANTLSIIQRNTNQHKYIQYVNNLSRETRKYFLLATIKT
jgi:hypothetical protein